MVHEAVFKKLAEIAKSRKTISYNEIAQTADISLDNDDEVKVLGTVLDDIADQELIAGRPLLPIVVVSGKTGSPGAGLFKYAKRKKLQKGDDMTFFVTELKRVYDYWATAQLPE